MKTIGRVLIILVAASIVVGALLALVGNNSTSSMAVPNEPARGAPPSGEFQPGQFRGERGDHAGGAAGLTTILKNAGIFAGLSVAVAIVSTLRSRPRRKAPLAA